MTKSVLKLVILVAVVNLGVSPFAPQKTGSQSVAGCMSEEPASDFRLPMPTGHYGVGRVSYAFLDPSRPEPLAHKAGTSREVMVHVWYPTEPGLTAKGRTAPYLPGFDAAKPMLSQDDINDLIPPSYGGRMPETHTVENAPIARGNSKFPLLMFSHGWGDPTFLYTAELEDIVSHGYIVAAVDHTYDTTFTQFPDGRIVLFAQKELDAAAKQPDGYVAYARQRVEVMADDNRFVLTELLRYATIDKLHAPFLHRVDDVRIGAFGHSIGGLASARTCQIDNREKACIDQDSTDDRGSPFIATDLKETERQPFLLFVVSLADVTSPRKTHPDDAALAKMKVTRAEYDAIIQKQQANQLTQLESMPGGAYRVTLYDLPGFTHRSFADPILAGVSPEREQGLHNFHVTQEFTLAFFNKYLKGDRHTVLDTGQVVDPRAKVEKFPTKGTSN